MARSAGWFSPGVSLLEEPLVLHDASKVPFRVLRGISGIEAPVWSVQTTTTPGVEGSHFSQATASRPDVQVPVFLQAPDRASLRRLRDAIVVAMVPRGGAGKLKLGDGLGTDSGDERWCQAVYRGGLEGDGSAAGTDWWRFVLRFECLDPYWYSMEPVTASWAGKVGNNFFPFSFPFTLAPYGLDVTSPLDLGGNAESWPSFTLTGPFTRVRFRNVRTSEWWEVLRSNDERNVPLVVSTKPGAVSVRTSAGVNAYGLRTAGSQFFALSPGDAVSVVADGVSGATRFDLTVWPAWLTAP